MIFFGQMGDAKNDTGRGLKRVCELGSCFLLLLLKTWKLPQQEAQASLLLTTRPARESILIHPAASKTASRPQERETTWRRPAKSSSRTACLSSA